MALNDFLSAYRGREAQMAAQPVQELQQVGALQGILASVQKQQMAQQAMQEEAQIKGVLAQTGGNPQAAIQKLMATGNPKAIDLATKIQSSFVKPDAQMEQTRTLQAERMEQQRALQTERLQQQAELARQRSEDQRLSQAERNQARMDMIRLAASLRPAPQVQPLVPYIGSDGKPVLGERKDAIGKTPAGVGSKAELVEAGKADVDKDVMTLKSAIDSLNEGGGITSTSKGVIPNLGRWASNTGVGQTLGSMGGTYNQKARDVIAQARPLLLRSIMQATGMSARSLDSNAELKLWLSTATDPTKGYEANIEALNNIAAKYGSGAFMEGGQQATGKIGVRSFATEADAIKSGVKGDVIIGGRKARID